MNPRGPGPIAMTLRLFVENMAVSWLCPNACSMNAPFKADKTNNGSRRKTLGENKENPASPKQYYSKMLWKLFSYA